MVGFRYLSLKEAIDRGIGAVKLEPRPTEKELAEAYRLVSAENIKSKLNVPFMNTSFVDGYAVRSSDVSSTNKEKPAILRLAKRTRLGEIPNFSIKAGECCYVPTGGFVPEGSDAVVMVEATRKADDGIAVLEPVEAGENLILAGSDFKEGDEIVRKGQTLRAQDLGTLNLLGVDKVSVYSKPLVGILSVGSELVEAVEEHGPGKVLASHRFIFSKLVEEAGGAIIDYGIAQDVESDIVNKLSSALRECDIILTIGGSSVGEADIVPDAINAMGEPGVIVHGIKVVPGRPTGMGVINGKPIFILPGLAQSGIMGYYALAVPFINMAKGLDPMISPTVPARISRDLKFARFQDFQKAVFVRACSGDDELVAEPIEALSYFNNVLIKANGFIMVPEGQDRLKKDEIVRIHQLPGFSTLPSPKGLSKGP